MYIHSKIGITTFTRKIKLNTRSLSHSHWWGWGRFSSRGNLMEQTKTCCPSLSFFFYPLYAGAATCSGTLTPMFPPEKYLTDINLLS